jgi:hypothetical protein
MVVKEDVTVKKLTAQRAAQRHAVFELAVVESNLNVRQIARTDVVRNSVRPPRSGSPRVRDR